MGISAAKSFTGYINDKWYHVKVDCHWDETPPPNTCENTYRGRCDNCLTGLTINNWLDAGHECVGPNELTFYNGTSAQNLIEVTGPFVNAVACRATIENLCSLMP